MALDATLTATNLAFAVGRALFALVVGYLAVGNLLDLESAIGYARHKGAPLPSVTVPLGSLGLVAGSLAVLAGVFPRLGAVAVVAFLLPITAIMHDFWNAEGEERQNERIHFLKNVGLVGTALALLAVAGVPWPLAAGVGF